MREFYRVPVSLEDFEAGDILNESGIPKQVVAYLQTHCDQAFTCSEIATAIDEDPNAVGTALSRLKDRDLVRHKGEYWALTDDEQRVATAYDLHVTNARLNDENGGVDSTEWDTAAPDTPHPSELNVDEDEHYMQLERDDIIRVLPGGT